MFTCSLAEIGHIGNIYENHEVVYRGPFRDTPPWESWFTKAPSGSMWYGIEYVNDIPGPNEDAELSISYDSHIIGQGFRDFTALQFVQFRRPSVKHPLPMTSTHCFIT